MTTACAPSGLRRTLGTANAAACLLLLVAGGMVTSTASGLAVPDWPLSYGTWLPSMTGGIFYEHGHRLFASLVGFLILSMAVLTQREETRPGVRRLAWWTLVLVMAQGVLGGVTVFLGLPVVTSAAHATIGQTVFCLLVAMADLVGEDAPAGAPAPALRRLAALALGALWFQLVLGAVLRHGGAGLRWHLLGAGVSTFAALWAGAAVLFERREPALRGPAQALLALLGLQLLLGAGAAAFRLVPSPRTSYAMIALATTHLAVGGSLLACATLLNVRLARMRPEAR